MPVSRAGKLLERTARSFRRWSDTPGAGQERRLEGEVSSEEAVMTVWIYADTSRQVGDADRLKVFETAAAFDRLKDEHDPEGVAFECPVISHEAAN